MSKAKTYYHATDYSNLYSIMQNGLLANNTENIVYLCEKEEDAIKFAYMHRVMHAVTFKVTVRQPSKIIETFDHSQAFFKCRCFGFQGNIPAEWVEPSKEYDFTNL